MKNIYVELDGGKKIFMGKHTARIIKDATKIYKMIAKAMDPDDEANDAPNLYMMDGDDLDNVINTVCGWYDGLTYDELMDDIQNSRQPNPATQRPATRTESFTSGLSQPGATSRRCESKTIQTKRTIRPGPGPAGIPAGPRPLKRTGMATARENRPPKRNPRSRKRAFSSHPTSNASSPTAAGSRTSRIPGPNGRCRTPRSFSTPSRKTTIISRIRNLSAVQPKSSKKSSDRRTPLEPSSTSAVARRLPSSAFSPASSKKPDGRFASASTKSKVWSRIWR